MGILALRAAFTIWSFTFSSRECSRMPFTPWAMKVSTPFTDASVLNSPSMTFTSALYFSLAYWMSHFTWAWW